MGKLSPITYQMGWVKAMWVCKSHVTTALQIITAPHIQKAPYGITCCFCNDKAELNLYYAHKPSKFKRMKYKNFVNESSHFSQKQSS